MGVRVNIYTFQLRNCVSEFKNNSGTKVIGKRPQHFLAVRAEILGDY